MIWLRRTIVPMILLLAVGGYFGYGKWRAADDGEMLENCAQATAQIWVATATFREDEDLERLLLFRDSILVAFDLTTEEIETYAEADNDQPEKYHGFVTRVGELVDSLIIDRTGLVPDTLGDSIGLEVLVVPQVVPKASR